MKHFVFALLGALLWLAPQVHTGGATAEAAQRPGYGAAQDGASLSRVLPQGERETLNRRPRRR